MRQPFLLYAHSPEALPFTSVPEPIENAYGPIVVVSANFGSEAHSEKPMTSFAFADVAAGEPKSKSHVAMHRDRALADQLVGDRRRERRVGLRVDPLRGDRPAQHAAGGVDLLDRELEAPGPARCRRAR